MSDAPSPAQQSAETSSLAAQRLLWATRPMGLLLMVLWVLHPATTANVDYIHLSLIGFLVGLFYGLLIYGKKLRGYIVSNTLNQRLTSNRVPEEYYWGNILQTMFHNR